MSNIKLRIWVISLVRFLFSLPPLPAAAPLCKTSGLEAGEESASESERSKSELAPSGTLRLPSVLCLWAPHLVAAASAFFFFIVSLVLLDVAQSFGCLPSAHFRPFPPSTSPSIPVGAYTRFWAPRATQTPCKHSNPLCFLDHASPTSFPAPNPRRIPLAHLPLQRPTPPSAPRLVLFRPETGKRRS